MTFLGYVLATLWDTIKVLFLAMIIISLVCGAVDLLMWNIWVGTSILLTCMILVVSYGRYLNDQKKKN